MSEFKTLNKQDLEKDNKLVRILRDIGLDMCYEKQIQVNNVNYEQVTLENESWININFEINCNNPTILAEMNFELSKRLANNMEIINTDIEFIPSFISGETKNAHKFHGVS